MESDQNSEPTNPDFDKLSELADSGELTPETLNEKLNSYAEAYRQEFELDTKDKPENVEQYTRDFFKKNVHAAAAQIVWLSNNAESESVRASMSKYIVQAATENAEKDGDPIAELLKSLQKKSPIPTPTDS